MDPLEQGWAVFLELLVVESVPSDLPSTNKLHLPALEGSVSLSREPGDVGRLTGNVPWAFTRRNITLTY